MQVAVGGAMAEVSDDGRDIQFSAPTGGGKALVLPFPAASHAKVSTSGASLVAPVAKPDERAVAVDGSAAATLIFVALVAAIAVTRFVGRAGRTRDATPSSLHAPLDDAAFLKRYGRTP